MSIKALQGAARIRNAKTMARNMGVTIRSPKTDELQPTLDRYEVMFSAGLDSKTAKLGPSGSSYGMKPSVPKLFMTTLPTMGLGVYGAYLAYNGLMGKEINVLKIASGLGMIGASAAVIAPYNIDL